MCGGEGSGNPLQCSCLENPRGGGAWWAAVSGVAQSRTLLKQLSSSRVCGRTESKLTVNWKQKHQQSRFLLSPGVLTLSNRLPSGVLEAVVHSEPGLEGCRNEAHRSEVTYLDDLWHCLQLWGSWLLSSVQFSCSVVSDFVTPWTAACRASLSFTNSRSLLRLMFIKSAMPFNHFILCCPLLLLPSIFLSIRIFSNESVLRIRWPERWSLLDLQNRSARHITPSSIVFLLQSCSQSSIYQNWLQFDKGIPWWSRICPSTIGVMGSIPSWGTKITQTMPCAKKKKRKKEIGCSYRFSCVLMDLMAASSWWKWCSEKR